ncbi:MAG TPA: type IV pilus assembly protein PilM [Thermodesulfobacteriota bacterium]|nr:type IV pilus assembly protein PilM [Thermodesulfobacteriota bacterium]
MWFPRSDKENYIGVDIGSSAIKVCQLLYRRQEIILQSFGMAPLPPQSIANGVIQNPGIIADALKALYNHLQIKSKKIVFALSGYSVFIKKITLPVLSEKELSQSLQFEAQQHVPFDIKEVNLDFHILSPLRDDPGSMAVLLVAVKRETLGAYLEVIQLAGLEPVVADVAAFALANAYERAYPLDSGPIALLNLGASQSTFQVLGTEGSVFTRDIFLGGQQITEQIQSVLNISFEEAERIKLGEFKTPDLLDRITPAVMTTLQSWLDEIRKILDFLTASEPEHKPSKIVLAGGSAGIPGLVRFLSDGLQYPVELFNPFAKISFNPQSFDSAYLESVGPQAAISFGLALRQKGN